MSRSCVLVLAAVLTGAVPVAAQPVGGGIYTCVDAKGKRLTSDRPIPECLDREQKELNSSGTVRRVLGPTRSAAEIAAVEERDRKAAEEKQRQVEEKRLQRVLLARYPSQASHDAERGKALHTVQEAILTNQRRMVELQNQRKQLTEETEFYKSPAQWPPKLKRQFEENDQAVGVQQRMVAGQEEEKKRLNTRFDEELARLKTLWVQAAGTTAAGAPASAPR